MRDQSMRSDLRSATTWVGAATLLLLALFTALGSSGRKSLIAASTAALLASAVEAKIAYQIFLF